MGEFGRRSVIRRLPVNLN